MTIFFQRSRWAVMALASGLSWSVAAAADTSASLVEGQGITVTAQDVLGDALRIPSEVRHEVLGQPVTAAQLASNLYIFRTLAKQAQEQGLDQRPDVAAAMQIVQERVLADAWLNALDAQSRPDEKAAALTAEAIYKADDQKRFAQPEEVHVSHILIAGNDDAARAKAQEMLKALKNGADFAQLARTESADKGSGARGGDLGFFGRGRMVAPFEAAAFAMKTPGELSGPVETQFGQHILRLEARRAAGKLPFEEVRAALIEEVQRDAMQAARQAASSKIRQHGELQRDAIEAFAKAHAAPANAAQSQATTP